MMQRDEQVIQKHKLYFDKEAIDFDAVEKDPAQIKDPLRRLAYKYFIKLHKENKRLNATIQIARQHQPDWNNCQVLELGCGHGLYSIRFAKFGAHVTMVDFSQPMLDLARENLVAAGVYEQAAPILSDLLSFKSDRQFDLVFLTGVTDYLPKSRLEFLGKQLQRLARDLVIISFPKYDAFNWIRWLWLTSFKRLSLSYFSWQEVEQFARQHSFRIRYTIKIPGYFVVGLTKTGIDADAKALD